METFDIAIIGGGLIGCSIAFELASEKLNVVVLDKQEPGREASWAAAGILSPASESPDDIPLVALKGASLRIYSDFIRSVEQESGKPTGYSREGTLQIFSGRHAERERDEMIAQHKRLELGAEAISIAAGRAKEPSIAPLAGAVAFLPEEGTVEPRLLFDAVATASIRRNVQIRANCRVSALLQEQSRCVGVCAAHAEIIAKHVVLAAGCFSSQISNHPNTSQRYAPTRPVRGQMVALKRRGFRLQRTLRSEKGYLVPRSDGRIVAGSTTEEAGFEKQVTAAGISQILDAALELCPELAGAEVVETWAGLRPGTPDALPILGPTETEGLIVATGHYRNGILLAPITAKLVREWITTGRPNFDAKNFSPLRFSHNRQESVEEDAAAAPNA